MDTSQGHMTSGPGCTVEVDESLFGWLNHDLVSCSISVVNGWKQEEERPYIWEKRAVVIRQRV